MKVPKLLFLSFLVYIITGCTIPVKSTIVPDITPGKIPTTPTQNEMMGDTSFVGCAYNDLNNNGVIDSGEPLLGGIKFEIKAQGWKSWAFGGQSSEGDCAFILVPGALPASAWPVLMRIVLFENLPFEPIGSTEITLDYPQTRANFLFKGK